MQLYGAFMCQEEAKNHTRVANELISVLVDMSSMCHAQRVFDNLTYHDKHSASSLIAAYSKLGELRHALFLLRGVILETETYPHRYALLSFIKACSSMNDMEIGNELRPLLLNQQRWILVENDVFVGSALVSMHAKFGSLVKAREVFDRFMLNVDYLQHHKIFEQISSKRCGVLEWINLGVCRI